jgi:hypothetical protein
MTWGITRMGPVTCRPNANGTWTYTVLHRFTGFDGAEPDANLTLDDKGNIYGTTATGGAGGAG